MSSSWLFGSTPSGASPAPSSSSSSSESSGTNPATVATVWSSWTDAKKWEAFATKTQQDAIRLAEITQTEAIKVQAEAVRLSAIAGRVANEKATELSKHAVDTRNHYNPNDIGSSILYGLGLPASGSVDSSKPRNVTLESIDFVYITENIISMPFPADCKKNKCPNGMNDILDVANYLETHHKGHYMILNISEEAYDYSLFDNQVLEYCFPGHPAPPLGVLFKICVAVENWLDADDKNIVVVHCLTGKGRTAALTSCMLAWMGEFASPMEALHYICNRRKISVEVLTIPSQRRYVQYFGNMLDGIRPRSEPILLRRVIMNTIPKFEKKVTRVVHVEKEQFLDIQGTSNRTEKIVDIGCAPYVQLFKCGNLIATATPLTANDDSNSENSLNLSWINAKEGTISFTVNAAIRGDILLRCRHADSSGNANGRVSMFRAAFHTGYVPSGVLRLTREQLDGSGSDPRFDDDFFIDLIFAPVVKVNTTAAAGENESTEPSTGSSEKASKPVVSDDGLEIIENSEKYEQSLHKDARFWEGIANRKQKVKLRRPRKFQQDKLDHFIIDLNSSSDETDPSNTWSNSDSIEPVESSKPSAKTLISDDDLINQLAFAEQLLGGDDSDHGTGRSSPTFHIVDAGDYAASVSGSSVGVSSTSGSVVDINSSDVSAPVVPVTPDNSRANKELQALEDLERELGLEDLNMFSPTSSVSMHEAMPMTPVKKDTDVHSKMDDDVDLDELEQYLQTINSSSTK